MPQRECTVRLADYTLAELIKLSNRVAGQREKALSEARRLYGLSQEITKTIRTRCYESNGLLDLRVAERKRRERAEARHGD